LLQIVNGYSQNYTIPTFCIEWRQCTAWEVRLV
jgi:hypothetical protein